VPRFNPPPGWDVPAGFMPPVGWRPDPRWPEPPAGWSMWIVDPVETGREIDATHRGSLDATIRRRPGSAASASPAAPSPTTGASAPGTPSRSGSAGGPGPVGAAGQVGAQAGYGGPQTGPGGPQAPSGYGTGAYGPVDHGPSHSSHSRFAGPQSPGEAGPLQAT
jgi:hypothetical protein